MHSAIYTHYDGRVQEGVWKKGKFEYARKDPKVEKRRAAFELSFTKLKAEFEAERNE